MPIRKAIYALLIWLLPTALLANENVVNIYAWGGELPSDLIQAFENESGIKVNLTTFENNETMYAKLRAARNSGYDIIMPTSAFADRMRKQHMLLKLDKTLLPNLKNIDPMFNNPAFDPHSEYTVPLLWGVTGIFVNDQYHSPKSLQKWSDFWNSDYKNELMMLDDVREVFSMALLALGYSANDNNPEHIKAAYLKLKELVPNIKVFASDMSTSVMIDEDVTTGMAWNGDVYKATLENPHIQFVYPKDGFVIWIDNFAILENAPHKLAAYRFLNYILRPEAAMRISEVSGYPTANLATRKQLPKNVSNNSIIYPSSKIINRGEYITDASSEILALYEKYWEELKMQG